MTTSKTTPLRHASNPTVPFVGTGVLVVFTADDADFEAGMTIVR